MRKEFITIPVMLYLIVGILMMLFLLQTPYADNPLWTMILLWPFYAWG